MPKQKTLPPAVVTPSDRPATLGIARSLGRRGISVYGVDSDPWAYALASRYLKACPLPTHDHSDENRLQFLLDLGKKLGGKALLFPVSDEDMMLCSRESKELEKYYIFVLPEHKTVSDLLTKDGLSRVANTCGIPSPEVILAIDLDQIQSQIDSISFPVILKPVYSPAWLRPEIASIISSGFLNGAPKVAVCNSPDELIQTYTKIAFYDPQMIIQEIIPGEDDHLAYFCFYLDRESRPLATFAGRKIRVLPIGFGSATYVQSFRDPELEAISLKLLSGTKFRGLGGVEFKRDARDERYKLIEFNARYGLWDALSIRCGIDMPYIAYRDALGMPVEPQHDYRENVKWIDMQRDIRAFFMYNRHKELKLRSWLRSLQGEKDWAIHSFDDWKPAIVATVKLLGHPWSSLKRRFG